ncbi:MAG TPA: biotin--[acetyl-CoA-carboxylase] ligase [Burkholderiaceae bacterium]|nr:biotin--[acetyl-CoA-carboxylase] ligase [Burkholderiaceae bacterium]
MQTQAVIQWPAEAIWEQIVPLLPGFTIEILPEIGSTNTELMRRAKEGKLEPILLVAEKQTAGRGRLGRDWIALTDRVDNALPMLTFSLGMPLSPISWSGLSLAIGVSLASSLDPRIRLKWPNDLWLNERKLAGILIETTVINDQRFAVIGIGINILQAQPFSTSALRTAPAWLHEINTQAQAANTLAQVIAPLISTIQLFETQGFAPFQKTFNALDALHNRTVLIQNNAVSKTGSEQLQGLTQGLAQGVDDAGALIVLTESGRQLVSSSEVSIKPI